MSPSLFERVRGITADVLTVPADQLNANSSSKEIAAWDSVHHLNLVLALEQEFEVQFDPEEIDSMISIGQIIAVLESKLSKPASA